MSVELNSFSSSLMLGTTLYRNQHGFSNKLIAQVGYALTALVAVIETIAASLFLGLSLLTLPFSSTPSKQALFWLGSSAFCIGWSITDFFLNPWVNVLVADQKSARQILNNGNLMEIPHKAVL